MKKILIRDPDKYPGTATMLSKSTYPLKRMPHLYNKEIKRETD
jgi:hypothetical protein